MRFINDDQVKVRHGGHSIFVIVQDPLYHALDRGDLDTGLAVYILIFQALDVINIIKGHQIFQLNFFEHV